MQYVPRKSGKPPLQIDTQSSGRIEKRFSDDEYDQPYSENLSRSGYCHRLPIGWRNHLSETPQYDASGFVVDYMTELDTVLWFTNEGTEFLVGSTIDVKRWIDLDQEDRATYTVDVRWFMVCCPIQPSKVTSEETSQYWEAIKSNRRPEPKYPRVIDYIKVQALPSIDEYATGLTMLCDRLKLGLRFQPQYQVLSTMCPSNDRSFDLWIASNLVSRQISYEVFCAAATRQLFRSLRSGSGKP